MPYKDPEKKLAAMKRWRKESIAKGYGKWLYKRRRLRFDDAERFRAAIEQAIDKLMKVPPTSKATPVSDAINILSGALAESLEAEEKLGRFEEEK